MQSEGRGSQLEVVIDRRGQYTQSKGRRSTQWSIVGFVVVEQAGNENSLVAVEWSGEVGLFLTAAACLQQGRVPTVESFVKKAAVVGPRP